MTEPDTSASCLDAGVVAEIRALSGPGENILAEVLALFVADVPQQLLKLREALDGRDTDAARRIAHRLKGTALGLGARRMAAACGLVENAARDGEPDRSAAYAEALNGEFQAARLALEREAGA